MKRIYISFLIICMLFMVLPCCAAATEYLTITNVDVSYADKQIIVECQSTALYRQRIVAQIYETQVSSPSWSDYDRAVEGVTDTDGKCILSLKLGTDMENDKYTVVVRGSGTKSADSKDTENFEIIPLNEASDVLNSFNSANEGSLQDLYNTYKVAFEIDEAISDSLYTTNQTEYLATVSSIRNQDFENGQFNSLDEARDAFKTAGELISLSKSSSAASVGTNLSENAEIYGIDVEGSDYVSVKDTANNLFMGLNTADKAKSAMDVKKKFAEALSVAMVVTSDVPSLDAVVKRYESALGISSMMTQYNQMTSAQKSAVVRYLTDKDFKNADAVAAAFSEALLLVASDPTVIPDSAGSTVSGGGGGGGGGGSSDAADNNKTNVSETKPVINTTTKLFSDLHQYEWAQESIEVLYKRGVINGYGDGTFGGNKSVTRSEFIKMVVIAFGVYDSAARCEFSDVDDENWAHSFIGSAVKNGLVFGREDGSFGASDAITREDAAVMIYRAAKAIGLTLEGENIISFTDASELSDYSVEAVRILSRAAVINGFEDGSFAPKASLTRAQSAKIIYEILKRI